MTTSAGGRRKTDACNGVTTAFNAPQFESTTDLLVYLHSTATFDPTTATRLTEGTDYTITGSGPLGTAQVVTTTAYATGHWLTRFRATSRAQTAAFAPNDGIGAAKLDTALDTGALIDEEQDDDISDLKARALLVPRGEAAPSITDSTSRDNTVLGFLSGAARFFTSSALAAWLVTSLVPLLPGNLKGDPGGNAMAVGAFSSLASLSIPVGTDLIQTSAYTAGGKVGAALYIADAAVDAAFVTAHPGWSVRTANGRGFRLYEQQPVWFEMLGGVADADHVTKIGTDNIPPWLVARDFIHYFRDWPTGNYYYKPSIPIIFRAKSYYFSDALDLTDAAYVLWGGGNGGYGQAGTLFIIASGKCGMLLQSWDTQGTNGTKTDDTTQPYGHGASSSRIADIMLYSKGGTVGAFQHGFVLKCQAQFDRCFATNFGGDGFHIAADVNTAGNANAWKLKDCGATANGLAGLYLDGGDGNAGYSIGFQAFRNGTWGIYDSSFLGNHHFFFQTDGNGTVNSGPDWVATRPSTFTNLGGHKWRVRPGAHVAASTTTPGTNGAVWVDYGAGSTALGGSWVSGQAFVSGGAFYADDNNARCVFAGYQEGDQAGGWMDSTTSGVLPGFSSADNGATIGVANSTYFANRIGTKVPGATAAHFVTVTFGSSGNVFMELGNSTSGAQPWQFFCDDNDHVSQLYNAAAGSGSFDMYAPGSSVGFGVPRGIAIQNVNMFSGTAAPVAGTWARGSIVKNEAPSVGQPKGWICTVAGTPGTWVSEGNL